MNYDPDGLVYCDTFAFDDIILKWTAGRLISEDVGTKLDDMTILQICDMRSMDLYKRDKVAESGRAGGVNRKDAWMNRPFIVSKEANIGKWLFLSAVMCSRLQEAGRTLQYNLVVTDDKTGIGQFRHPVMVDITFADESGF